MKNWGTERKKNVLVTPTPDWVRLHGPGAIGARSPSQGHLALQWRHNENHGVSNHRRFDCLLNRVFWCRSKRPKIRATGLCEGNSSITGEPVNFPTQRASNQKMFPFDDAIMSWVLYSKVCLHGRVRWVAVTVTILEWPSVE